MVNNITKIFKICLNVFIAFIIADHYAPIVTRQIIATYRNPDMIFYFPSLTDGHVVIDKFENINPQYNQVHELLKNPHILEQRNVSLKINDGQAKLIKFTWREKSEIFVYLLNSNDQILPLWIESYTPNYNIVFSFLGMFSLLMIMDLFLVLRTKPSTPPSLEPSKAG